MMIKGFHFLYFVSIIVLILYHRTNHQAIYGNPMTYLNHGINNSEKNNGKSRYTHRQEKRQIINNSPIVKIITPQNNSRYEWNTPIRYLISVSDKEDGESKFQEIPSGQVSLEVRYQPDTSKLSAYITLLRSDPGRLAVMRTSDCFNCHAMKTRRIGPSFLEIAKKYPPIAPNVKMLGKRIINGTSGAWGNVAMPGHPGLNEKEAQNIIEWFMQNALDPNFDYYAGIEGSLKLKPLTGKKGRGSYILIARYTDHGIKEKANENLTGEDIIVLR